MMAQINVENAFKLIFLTVLIILSTGSNLVVIVTILKNKRLRNTFNYLLVSLAFADLLVGLFVIPFYMVFVIEETWYTSNGSYFYLYAVYICLDIFTGISSIFNIAVMSLDRALLIFSPNLHARTLGKKRIVTKVVCLPWLVAGILVIPKILQYHSNQQGSDLVMMYFIVGFVLPLLLIAASYIYMFVRHRKLHINNDARLEKDMKLAYMTLLIVIVFIVCWCPFFVVMLYFTYCNPCKRLKALTIFVKWMQFFHSCCNPFIYALLQPSLRQAFFATLSRCLPGHLSRRVGVEESIEMTEQIFQSTETANEEDLVVDEE